MQFDKLMARNRNLETADTSVAKVTLDGFPVVQNTSGLRQGEVILRVADSKVVIPTIQGQKRTATVVLFCEVIDTNGQLVPRIVFLSTLIRKINLDAKYNGMVNDHPLFKDHGDFTNKQWVDAFSKAAPFQIADIDAKDRVVNMPDAVGNPTSTINVKELTLKKLTEKEAKKLISTDSQRENSTEGSDPNDKDAE